MTGIPAQHHFSNINQTLFKICCLTQCIKEKTSYE